MAESVPVFNVTLPEQPDIIVQSTPNDLFIGGVEGVVARQQAACMTYFCVHAGYGQRCTDCTAMMK